MKFAAVGPTWGLEVVQEASAPCDALYYLTLHNTSKKDHDLILAVFGELDTLVAHLGELAEKNALPKGRWCAVGVAMKKGQPSFAELITADGDRIITSELFPDAKSVAKALGTNEE